MRLLPPPSLVIAALLAPSAIPAATVAPGVEQDLECVKNENGVPFLRWWGVAGRSYFIQVSDPADPLRAWVYSTCIEQGRDEIISYQLSPENELPDWADLPPAAFFRLRHVNRVPGPGETPDTADYDGDGLSNLEELENTLTDPLNPDTDGDGMDDGWETANGLDPNDPTGEHGAGGDPDGDGLTNLVEFLAGSDPRGDGFPPAGDPPDPAPAALYPPSAFTVWSPRP